MPSVTSLSFKAGFTAKGMTLAIPPGWLKPTEGKTEKTNEDWGIADLRNHGITDLRKDGVTELRKYGTKELRSHGTIIFSWYPLFVSKWDDYALI